MIRINNITKRFGEKLAVDNISLDIKDGEIFGLLGPNGAGKSTTLKMITGILKPDEGDIYLDESSITKDDIKAKMKFGYVPDSPDMFLGLKGKDYLAFITSVYKLDKEKTIEKIKNLTQKLNIYDDLNSFISEYSHGMRQKLFIIGALLHDPKYLILDEPMTGLDPSSAHLIKEIMKECIKENRTVLYSTHVLDVAEKICTRVGIIDKGKLLCFGTIDELKKIVNKDEGLESLFLDLTK